jgi:hypothetical protein
MAFCGKIKTEIMQHFLSIKPTDALNSNFIGITTLQCGAYGGGERCAQGSGGET